MDANEKSNIIKQEFDSFKFCEREYPKELLVDYLTFASEQLIKYIHKMPAKNDSPYWGQVIAWSFQVKKVLEKKGEFSEEISLNTEIENDNLEVK